MTNKIIVDVEVVRQGNHGATILKYYNDGSCDKLTCSNELVQKLMKRARRNYMYAY